MPLPLPESRIYDIDHVLIHIWSFVYVYKGDGVGNSLKETEDILFLGLSRALRVPTNYMHIYVCVDVSSKYPVMSQWSISSVILNYIFKAAA